MSVFLIFSITALISFAGSIHIGPVNLMVIRTSLQKDYISALLVGLGGSLPELFYATIAVTGLAFLKQHPALISQLNQLVIPFFLIVGLSYFLPRPRKTNQSSKTIKNRSFIRGFLLACFNPQLLPFWFATIIYLHSFFAFDTIPDQLAFIGGTASGAFALLSLYAWLAKCKKKQLNLLLAKVNFDVLMGFTFLLMAILKLII